jgi:hypothetical protein
VNELVRADRCAASLPFGACACFAFASSDGKTRRGERGGVAAAASAAAGVEGGPIDWDGCAAPTRGCGHAVAGCGGRIGATGCTGAPLDFARLQRNARSVLGYTIAASHVTSQEDPLHVERLERQISNAAACAVCARRSNIIMNAPGKYDVARIPRIRSCFLIGNAGRALQNGSVAIPVHGKTATTALLRACVM